MAKSGSGKRGNKDADLEAREVQIINPPILRLSNDHGSLELIMRNGEPAVVVDGKHIIRRTTLVQQLARRAP